MTTQDQAFETKTHRLNPLAAFKVVLNRYDYEIYLLRRNPLTMIGLVIVIIMVLVALLAPLITFYDPLDVKPRDRLQPPSTQHWMGTDDFGRDIYTRVVYASRVDLVISFSAVTLAVIIGVFLGSIAGFNRGATDEGIMRVLDVIQAFPAFILAMGLAVVLGSGTSTIIYVVAFIMIPIFARLIRSEVISARERGYAEVARGMGASNNEIIFRQILPNSLTPILVQYALCMSYAILDAAALSFIGLGVRPPTPEWGSMVNAGVKYISSGEWWMSIFPGLVMAITILGFNLIADGFRDVFDPKLRN